MIIEDNVHVGEGGVSNKGETIKVSDILQSHENNANNN